MPRAKVELLTSLTHTGRGRKFRKGFPQIITNAGDIQYYQNQSGFSVQVLDAPSAKTASPPVKKTPESPPDDKGGEETAPVWTRAKLEGLKKAQLVEEATKLEVFLDGDELKAEMVETILEALEVDDDE